MKLGELIFELYYYGGNRMMISHPNGQVTLNEYDTNRLDWFLECFLDKSQVFQQLILSEVQLDIDVDGEIVFMFNDNSKSMFWLKYDEINELVIFLKQIL